MSRIKNVYQAALIILKIVKWYRVNKGEIREASIQIKKVTDKVLDILEDAALTTPTEKDDRLLADLRQKLNIPDED